MDTDFLEKQANFLFGQKGKLTIFEKGMKEGLSSEPSIRALFITMIIAIIIVKEYEHNEVHAFMLLISIALVFVTEIINTSIEAVVDRISLKYHFLSGYAKDLGSTATICWVIFAVFIWYKWFKKQWNFKKEGKKSFFNNYKKIVIIIILGLLSYPLTHYLLDIYRYIFKIRIR